MPRHPPSRPPPRRRPRPPASPRRPAPPPLPDLAEALGGARRVALVGVGSELRGDDVAGLLVARRLAAWAARAGRADLLALEGGAAPENFTGELVRFRPELVILVDAAHLAAGPGAVEVIPAAEVQGASFSTHMLPVPIFLDYLRHMTGCRTLVLGIGLAQKDVLAPPHAEVALAVRRLTAALKRALAPAPVSARRS